MANIVLIIGDSGTGKSTSLRNFKDDEVFVINCAGKPLPFKNHFEQFTPAYERLTKDVQTALKTTNKKVVVVDDAQYIMSFQYMRRIKENGWDKWNDIQGDFFNIIKDAKNLPEDVVVYFLSHLQRDDAGHEKVKTMGKMLDEKITIEGLFTIVLKTAVNDGTYCFLTQNSGFDTVKSPLGMFPSYAIDNDLKYVDTKIRNYYEIGEYADDEEVAQMDQEAEKAEISKPDPSARKSRRKKTAEAEKTTEEEGSGTADGQGTVPKSASSTDAAEQPKTRRRKDRSEEIGKETDGKDKEEKHEKAPAEEAKEETEKPKRRRKAHAEATDQPESASKDVTEEEPASEEKPKRRRKKKEEMPEWMNIPEDVPDEEVPFN